MKKQTGRHTAQYMQTVRQNGTAPEPEYKAPARDPHAESGAAGAERRRPQPEKSRDRGKRRGRRGKKKGAFGRTLAAVLCFVLETVILLVIGLYSVMFMLAKGPSETASRLFVRSVKETSAIGFLANLYFSEAEIDTLMGGGQEKEYVQTDVSLVHVEETAETGAATDAWGLSDEDGDGIILDEVKGEGYAGYMMIVLDPARVIVGTDPASYGERGYTVEEYVAMFDAVAGVNGGAFTDAYGMGNGSYPRGLVVFEGQSYNTQTENGFAGIDDKHILHVGCQSAEDAAAANIQYGVSFGPMLIQNGEMNDSGVLESGLNPRTAIGQRSDGAFLLLVIDGRQVASLGASYQDLADVMADYGAVNAINLDGGSSSMMWYGDSYVNNCASVVGIRPIPTSIVVLKKAEG